MYVGAVLRLNESAVSVPESVGSLQVCVELVDVLDSLQREVVVRFMAVSVTTGTHLPTTKLYLSLITLLLCCVSLQRRSK